MSEEVDGIKINNTLLLVILLLLLVFGAPATDATLSSVNNMAT
ncbi:hypothetical protein [Paenisporosarcina cavernae]|nr:hypothetical protein [Paenisporosarcina cavernae]